MEFTDNEETVFQQTVEWLSSKLSSSPAFIKQQTVEFQIDPFTRTFTNDKGENIYLTAKEFVVHLSGIRKMPSSGSGVMMP